MRKIAGATHWRRGKHVGDEEWRERIEAVGSTTRRQALAGVSIVPTISLAVVVALSWTAYKSRPQSIHDVLAAADDQDRWVLSSFVWSRE